MWFLLCALILSIQGQRFWVSLCRTPCLSLAQGKGLIESGSYLDKRKLLTDFCCGEQVDNASTRDVLRFHGAKSSKGCLMMLVSMHGRFACCWTAISLLASKSCCLQLSVEFASQLINHTQEDCSKTRCCNELGTTCQTKSQSESFICWTVCSCWPKATLVKFPCVL